LAKVEISAQAERDLLDLWLYVAEDNSRAADRLLDHINTTVQMVARYPQMGKRRDALRTGLRSFAVGDYVMFYLPRDSGIVLVRVLSGYRDLDSLFD
jgi:toxin ParE1/3/4